MRSERFAVRPDKVPGFPDEPLTSTRKLHMKIVLPLIIAVLGFTSPSWAQSPSPAAATTSAPVARADVYHVHFAKAALGKAAELGDVLKKQAPDAPMPGYLIVLRHQDGDEWDDCVIEHLGTKATIEASRPAPPANQMALGDWHTDTFVNGPSWATLAKELGIDDATKSTASAYTVSMYRPEPGQREALEKFLSEPPIAPPIPRRETFSCSTWKGRPGPLSQSPATIPGPTTPRTKSITSGKCRRRTAAGSRCAVWCRIIPTRCAIAWRHKPPGRK